MAYEYPGSKSTKAEEDAKAQAEAAEKEAEVPVNETVEGEPTSEKSPMAVKPKEGEKADGTPA